MAAWAAPVEVALGGLPVRGAAELRVEVRGIRSAAGEIGCVLYDSERGFPGDATGIATRWLRADPAGVTCRFEGLPAGRYAVAVTHDLNGDKRTNTNLFGMPTEDWGVSNNIRPTLRAPRFSEAAVAVGDGAPVVIRVELAP